MTPSPAPVRRRGAAFFELDGVLIDDFASVSFQPGSAESRAAAVRRLAGRSLMELEALGARVTRAELAKRVRPEALELISSHRQRDHLIVVVTSAFSFEVSEIAREVRADAVVCTGLRLRDGLCTGDVDGQVLEGPAKASAIVSLAADLHIDLSASYAYAANEVDAEFLCVTGNPVVVDPDRALRATARERQWPSLSFQPRMRTSRLLQARSAAAYGGLAGACLLGATVGAIRRDRRAAANTVLSLGGDASLAIAGVDLRVTGEHNLWSARPAVFMANHQSNLDALALFKLLRRDFTTIAKKEIGQQLGLAQFAWLINAALVDRSDAAKAREAMAPALERLRDGWSIVVAPEGTRSVSTRLGPFKKGPFHLAIQGGVPLVPIVFRNTWELHPRGSRVIRPGVVDVAVLRPIDTSGWTSASVATQVQRTQELYEAVLGDWSKAEAMAD
jgi:putative phosphoserine phosphatase / 1-acylglycerol-3-phosphate O-acyltransferase